MCACVLLNMGSLLKHNNVFCGVRIRDPVESQQRVRVFLNIRSWLNHNNVFCGVRIRDPVESQQRVRVCSSIWDIG